MCSPTKIGKAVVLEVLDPKLKLYEPFDPIVKRFEPFA
jgi:hypothetical protein